MKKIILLVIAISLGATALFADGKKKPKAAAPPVPVVSNEINWMTIEEVQVAMKKEPRKVYIDVYTGWCGWCKKMDKTTFSNKAVIEYMNKNFYSIKFDAEQKDPIHFLGKQYDFMPQYKANQLAVDLLRGQMSYPTSVIMEENFLNPQPIQTYLDVPQMEMVLKYFGEGMYKKQPFEQFQKEFKPTWM